VSTRSVESVTNRETAPTTAPSADRRRTGTGPRKSGRATGQKWTRRLHSWLSTTSILVVLFFALTGITLNHPTWFGASTPRTQTVTGVLPASVVINGTADPLAVSEYLRVKSAVSGQVAAHTETSAGGTIDYEGPGSAASVDYTTSTRAYQLRTTSYGLVGILNDLHKGRHAGSSFAWLIDVSGVLLTLVAVTGLTLQLYIRRGRRLGLTLAGIGAAAAIVLM
jgi:hypothetical protein